jgi:undecaprenyl diphosphate synthase
MAQPEIQLDRVPHHVAIIMDGNGRWALSRGLERNAGHRDGI